MGRWMDRARGGQEKHAEAAAPDAAERNPGAPIATVSVPTSADLYDIRPTPAPQADPSRAWHLRNAELLTEEDRRLGHDPGGFCAAHGRWLSYPEQRRGACSWCVPVDPAREPEYWAGRWRRFTGR